MFEHLKAISAKVQRFYPDDAPHRMLNSVPIEKERAGKTQWRSGAFPSAALAAMAELADPSVGGTDPPLRRWGLLQTNIGHAGVSGSMRFWPGVTLHWASRY